MEKYTAQRGTDTGICVGLALQHSRLISQDEKQEPNRSSLPTGEQEPKALNSALRIPYPMTYDHIKSGFGH